MSRQNRKTWLRRRIENAATTAFTRAYDTVRVDPDKFLLQLRTAHGLPVASYQGMFTMPLEALDEVAGEIIASGMKTAAAQGAGFGLFGLATILPDLSILAAITMRTIEKLSLLYGFEVSTEQEVAELWMAAASAAGVDVGRELLEKELLNKVVPRIIRRVAMQMGAEMSEKLAGRLLPFLSSAVGAALNYYFVRAWGQRAMRHFREKHLHRREQLILEQSAQSAPSELGAHRRDSLAQ